MGLIMYSKKDITTNNQGNITVCFLFLIGIIAGAFNYSLFVGRKVDDKMKLQHGSDLAALSMASHTSHAMNMIATNNLAIGASLHIAAASQFVGRYQSIIKTLMYNTNDTNLYDKQNFLNDHSDSYNSSAVVSSIYIKTAKNLTSVNKNLVGHWLKGAIHKSYEQLNLNLPGPLALPIQMDKDPGDLNFTLPNLYSTTAKDAMCQTIKSSINVPNRDDYIKWLKAPLESMGLDGSSLDSLSQLESTATSMHSNFKNQIKVQLDLLQPEYKTKCKPQNGNGNNSNLTEVEALQLQRWCQSFEYWTNENSSIPAPKFSGCGINYEGDLAQQFQFFSFNETDFITHDSEGQARIKFCHVAGNNSNQVFLETALPGYVSGHIKTHQYDHLGNCQILGTSEREFDIGFVVPKISTPEEAENFEQSLNFGLLAMLPSLSQSDLPSSCPDGWRDEKSNRCHHAIAGEDIFLKLRENQDLWEKMLWSYSEAKAYFSPTESDPQTGVMSSPEDYDAIKARLFWPAWKSRLKNPENVIRLIDYIKEGQI